jgi:hypothetical protein
MFHDYPLDLVAKLVPFAAQVHFLLVDLDLFLRFPDLSQGATALADLVVQLVVA